MFLMQEEEIEFLCLVRHLRKFDEAVIAECRAAVAKSSHIVNDLVGMIAKALCMFSEHFCLDDGM